MLRGCHLPPLATPALCALRVSWIPYINLSSPPSIRRLSTFAPFQTFLPQVFGPISSDRSFSCLKLVPPMGPKARAAFSAGSDAGGGKEILVQHLLVKEDDLKLLLDLQQRISGGEDLSDLAVEHSICPSKEEGGMIGWVRKGQMVPEFEDAAFSAPLNKVVRCKTKFGWHLLQVISEKEESLLQDIQPDELHAKMQVPNFLEEAQLVDVREPEEVAQASVPGFQVLPLRQFGSWGPEITTKLDPQKDTYVMSWQRTDPGETATLPHILDPVWSYIKMCHHGMRSLQVARWLLTQGFRRVYNVSGGIHAYALKADQSIPTY